MLSKLWYVHLDGSVMVDLIVMHVAVSHDLLSVLS
jgi:hypothetical protein